MTIDPLALKEILNALTVEQWLKVAKAVAAVKTRKHGEIILTVKNGELCYLDVRLSQDVGDRKGKAMPKISLPLEADDPYFLALMDMGAKQRKVIVRQVVLLCMAIEGLTPEGALEVLARVGIWMNERPQTAEYHTLRLAGLQLFQKLQK